MVTETIGLTSAFFILWYNWADKSCIFSPEKRKFIYKMLCTCAQLCFSFRISMHIIQNLIDYSGDCVQFFFKVRDYPQKPKWNVAFIVLWWWGSVKKLRFFFIQHCHNNGVHVYTCKVSIYPPPFSHPHPSKKSKNKMNKRTNKTTTKNIYPLHNAKFLREYNKCCNQSWISIHNFSNTVNIFFFKNQNTAWWANISLTWVN